MSRFTYSVRPALFDIFTNPFDSSLESSLAKEVERILISRHLSKELEGLCSDFGIPIFEGATSEHIEKIEYAIAYYIMKFETRLEKTTVKVQHIKNGKIEVSIDLFPYLEFMPFSMSTAIQM